MKNSFELHDCDMNFRIPTLVFLLCFFIIGHLCAQACSDPDATAETRALYKNLYALAGKKILIGHQDDPCYGVSWKYAEGRSDIRDVTKEYPALYGFDLGRIELGWTHNLDSVPFEKTKQYIREAYARGGVITLSWHLNNPLTGLTAWDNQPGAVASVLPGGTKNALYTLWLDRVAGFLNDLKGQNGEPIPVILRLFHELNGGWFWWGKNQCSAEEMKQLFRYTIHYLRKDKNIHHLLYAFNTDKFNSGEEYLERYPGDDLMDILGFDIYQANNLRANEAFISFFNKDLTLIDSIAMARHKIPALTEFGYNEVPDSTWWTKVFLPTVTGHRIVYALAWRNAGRKSSGNAEFYVPYRDAASAPDFIKMAGSGLFLFENGIKSKNIYK